MKLKRIIYVIDGNPDLLDDTLPAGCGGSDRNREGVSEGFSARALLKGDSLACQRYWIWWSRYKGEN